MLSKLNDLIWELLDKVAAIPDDLFDFEEDENDIIDL